MAIGIKITDNIRAEIGEIKEKFLADLAKSNIDYIVPFDKTNKEGIKETIIHIKETETEISLSNDIVSFIKTTSNEMSLIAKIEDKENRIQYIEDVKANINKLFEADDKYNIRIEKIDTTNFTIVAIIYNDDEKVRVHIIRDNYDNLYAQTIKSI